jgi:hypothetical protein
MGYPGSKQANFNPILNKYYAVLNEVSMKRFVYLQIQSEKMLLLLNVSPSADTATVSKSTTTNQLCIWSPPKTNLDPENGLPKNVPEINGLVFGKKLLFWLRFLLLLWGWGS